MSTSTVPADPRSRPRRPSPLRGADFRRITGTGERTASRLLTLFVVRDSEGARAGFTATRKVGGAVVRNRARRLMREAWRSLGPQRPDGAEVVFVAQPSIRGLGLAEVRTEMVGLLERAGVLG